MKVYFNDKEDEFRAHLIKLKELKVIPYSKEKLNRKISQKIINKSFDCLNHTDFFDYRIFPVNILKPYTQWADEKREINLNDTILQQIHLPPFLSFSQKVITGVRVTSITNTNNIKEFAYETLVGHVEKGISYFRLEPIGDNSVITIETYSSPALSFLKLFQPITSLYQDYCTNQALQNLSANL